MLTRNVPVRRLELDGRRRRYVATVFDLMVAHYGIDRGLGGDVAASYDDDVPYTPAWQESDHRRAAPACDQRRAPVRQERREDRGPSMVILGAGLNHWYHMDMAYRGIINMLVMCGCVGKPGGGWSHYVGQEKLRPQTGWLPLAFALDWHRPPRHMNSTSFFYAHTDQWRYEKLTLHEILSPLADPAQWSGSLIDFNVRAERMGWLPSSPQLETNPLEVCRAAEQAGKEPIAYAVESLKSGRLRMSCEDPDNPKNFPRNLFVWRSNLLGASGKGHEYFLKHLLGAKNGVLGKDLGEDGPGQARGGDLAREQRRRQARPAGHDRLPHEHDRPVLRHRAADRDLVREERPQHHGHAPVHPPAARRRSIRCGSRAATGTSSTASPRLLARPRSAISASRRIWC